MLVIFNAKGESVGVLTNDVPNGTPYFNDLMKETLENFGLSLEFDIPADSPSSTLIENEGFIVYKTKDGYLQLFQIKETFKTNQDGMRLISVYAENSAVSEIITQPIRPQEHTGKTLIQYAPIILANTGWELGECDFLGIQDVKFDDYTNALDALQTVVKAFGAEVEFEVKLNGSEISQRLIHFRKRGTFTGKVFEYSKDMKGIKRTEDSKNLVTALIGVGKANDNGTILTFTSTNVTVPSGYVKSGDFVYSQEAFQKYARNGRQVFGVYKDETATNATELFQNTLTKLKELEKPLVNYEIDVVLLESITGYEHERVRLGDTIIVKDFSFTEPMLVEARVIELERSNIDPMSDKVVLGNFIPRDFSRSDEIQRLQQTIFLKEQAWSSAGQNASEAYQLASSHAQDIENLNNDVSGVVTDMAEVLETVETVTETVNNQSDAISNLEQVTTGTHIIETVLNSQSYINTLAEKANVDDLGVYITHEEVSTISQTLKDEMTQAIGGIDFSPYATKAEVTATANQLDFKFSSSGGVNLLKNSTGFAGIDFWSSVGSTGTVQNQELAVYGIGSGFNVFGDMGILRQTVTLAIDTTYTVSTICRKPTEGYTHLKVYFDGDTQTSYYATGTDYDHVLTSITFTPRTSNEVTIELYGEYTNAIFTGTMLNVGEVALQWQHSSGEVYNTNVLMDMNGIKVNSNQYNGYTAITPEEFAGYAEVNGVMTRVFTLNNDVTEVKKLDAEEQIVMSPIKLVAYRGSRSGWAWLPE